MTVKRVSEVSRTEIKSTTTDQGIAFKFVPTTGFVQGKKAAGISMDMIGDAKIGLFKSFYYAGIQTYNLTAVNAIPGPNLRNT